MVAMFVRPFDDNQKHEEDHQGREDVNKVKHLKTATDLKEQLYYYHKQQVITNISRGIVVT